MLREVNGEVGYEHHDRHIPFEPESNRRIAERSRHAGVLQQDGNPSLLLDVAISLEEKVRHDMGEGQ